MSSALHTAFFQLARRAEVNASETLMSTFVDVGPLFTLLSSKDQQILYGRRGTGKTHALRYLGEQRAIAGDFVAYVDLRNIGSSGGIYADPTRNVKERATCLLVDTLAAVHETLYSFCITRSKDIDLSSLLPALDRLAESITEVRVVGTLEVEDSESNALKRSDEFQISAGASSIGFGAKSSSGESEGTSQRVRRAGTEQLYVNFGSTGAAFRELVTLLDGRHIWILLDEWSSIPSDLQPYLADLLRRSVFPCTGVTVKIAAIEKRTKFQIRPENGGYIGIEIGADAAADLNLDDFMVFDNDPNRATAFFSDLLFRHVRAVDSNLGIPTADELLRQAFTQDRSFEEFVRASEGVPRDAMNILSLAAQHALGGKISKDHVRKAGKIWYQRDKDTALKSKEGAEDLIHWIIDKVIGERRARACLLLSNIADELVESLYDSRILHILKRGISTHDQPGVRYDAYKLDYGCYVDLISTAKAPLGLFQAEDAEDEASHVEVPPDDYRSIRRAILDLEDFYAKQGLPVQQRFVKTSGL